MARSDGISLPIGQFLAQYFERIGADHLRVNSFERTHRSTFSSNKLPSRAFPGIFGSQAEQLTQIIHQIFLSCLNDQETKVRYTAATAMAAYLKHNCDNTQLLNIYRDCLPCLIAVRVDTRESMQTSLLF